MEKEQILKLLEQIKYPGFSRDIVSFGMVGDFVISDQNIELTLNISTENTGKINQVVSEIKLVLSKHFSMVNVKIESKKHNTAKVPLSGNNGVKPTISNVKHIIAIASGKGGVGKSTVAANIAVALSNIGKKVGLLDLDIYGPSLPITFGVNEQPLMTQSKKLIPIDKDGIKLMSFGFISGNETPVIWRGPLVSRMTEQFFRDVEWGNLDFLILDLPPGTGDIQLTLTQKLRLSGAVIITTPQDIALADVRKGADMFKKVNTPVLGVVENMSGFMINGEVKTNASSIIINDQVIDLKENKFSFKIDLFKSGGGEKESERLGVPLLGKIPIAEEITISTDKGLPISKVQPKSNTGLIFHSISQKIIKTLT